MKVPPLTPEAKRWALRQLAQRAGVSEEFVSTWRIEFTEGQTIVRPGAETEKQVSFANIVPSDWAQMCRNRCRTLRASPPGRPGTGHNLPSELLVPYYGDKHSLEIGPLFDCASESMVHCSVDLLASVLFTLSRIEEIAAPKDRHGRVSARESLAFQDHFLDRPVVDEYGLAFEDVLRHLLPGWKAAPRRLRVKLSHDIDDVGTIFTRPPKRWPRQSAAAVRLIWMAMPWRVRAAVQETTISHSPAKTLRQLTRIFLQRGQTALKLVQELAALSLEYNLDSAFYWKSSALSPYDSGYDPRTPAVKRVIDQLVEKGLENGAHPGYDTFQSPKTLSEEVDIVRQATGEYQLGGRQHYLRWSPSSWTDWENCGLAYDSSVGFADHIGFRAGTCVPYHPWLLEQNREAQLLEIPLIAMDTTLTEYMNLSGERLLSAVLKCVDRCAAVGGVFTFLCHTTTLAQPEFSSVYRQLLCELAGSDRFDWRAKRSTLQSMPMFQAVGSGTRPTA